MKSNISRMRYMKLPIFIATLCFFSSLWLSPLRAEAAPTGGAVVAAIEGEAELSGSSGQETGQLQTGGVVKSDDAASTGPKSKLLLNWDSGLTASLGEYSSILLLPEDVNAPATNIQMSDGILRLAWNRPGASPPQPYSVSTPVASIQPESYDQPVDFIVESYDPTSTVITVVNGRVKVTNLTVTPFQEQSRFVLSKYLCHNGQEQSGPHISFSGRFRPISRGINHNRHYPRQLRCMQCLCVHPTFSSAHSGCSSRTLSLSVNA